MQKKFVIEGESLLGPTIMVGEEEDIRKKYPSETVTEVCLKNIPLMSNTAFNAIYQNFDFEIGHKEMADMLKAEEKRRFPPLFKTAAIDTATAINKVQKVIKLKGAFGAISKGEYWRRAGFDPDIMKMEVLTNGSNYRIVIYHYYKNGLPLSYEDHGTGEYSLNSNEKGGFYLTNGTKLKVPNARPKTIKENEIDFILRVFGTGILQQD